LLPVATLALSASTLTDTNFISQVYLDVLGRPVDPSGLSAGLAFLASNSPQTYALTVLDSTEYRTDLVSDYYQSYLARTPGQTEVSGFLMLLGSGGTDQQEQANVLGSAEYFAHHGDDDTNFVKSLFSALLNRPAAFGEVSLYVNLLTTNATTRSGVASDILITTEYEQDLLNGYLQQYLHRAFASGPDSLFLTQLEAAVRNEQVQSEILGSAEYYALAQQEQVPEPVTWILACAGLALLGFALRRQVLSRP
jgi:Domain of unknown function (DUF4214)/PEP-CTERM motif